MRSEVDGVASGLNNEWAGSGADRSIEAAEPYVPPPPQYRHPKKNWRLKRGATPQWYKQRNGVRTRAQSGAARVARFRPPGIGPRR